MTRVSLLLLCVTVGVAHAHGVSHERLPADDTVVLHFSHVLGEPLAAADVKVLAPDGKPWQEGAVDPNGVFAFVPDQPGDWEVVAEDDTGHSLRARISVGGNGVAQPASTPVRLSARWLLYGLLASLAVNAGFVSLVLARRRSRD